MRDINERNRSRRREIIVRKNWWWFVDGLIGDRDNVVYNWIFSIKLKFVMLKLFVFDVRV